MTWLTWRQFRAAAAMLFAALATLAAVLALTGPGLADDYTTGLTACTTHSGDCSDFVRQFFMFLLARMHEEWERVGDAPRAVREGLATTGRVVTAAAAIMVVVFGGFLFSPERFLKQFGLGLAVAIFLDALVIRCLIVPAVMQLFGTRHGGFQARSRAGSRGSRSSVDSSP